MALDTNPQGPTPSPQPVAAKPPPVVKEPKPEVIDPKIKGNHPAVIASAGQACTVEGCGWIFGDLVHGLEPHPTLLISTARRQPTVEPPKPEPPKRAEPDPKVCQPVGVGNTCAKCGWSAATSTETHPVM